MAGIREIDYKIKVLNGTGGINTKAIAHHFDLDLGRLSDGWHSADEAWNTCRENVLQLFHKYVTDDHADNAVQLQSLRADLRDKICEQYRKRMPKWPKYSKDPLKRFSQVLEYRIWELRHVKDQKHVFVFRLSGSVKIQAERTGPLTC